MLHNLFCIGVLWLQNFLAYLQTFLLNKEFNIYFKEIDQSIGKYFSFFYVMVKTHDSRFPPSSNLDKVTKYMEFDVSTFYFMVFHLCILCK